MWTTFSKASMTIRSENRREGNAPEIFRILPPAIFFEKDHPRYRLKQAGGFFIRIPRNKGARYFRYLPPRANFFENECFL